VSIPFLPLGPVLTELNPVEVKIPAAYHKGGRRSTFLSQSHRRPLLFDAKYPLTSDNSPPIVQPLESNTLSKKALPAGLGLGGASHADMFSL
jgi:hypothetical protein